jgi:hypothetical protein
MLVYIHWFSIFIDGKGKKLKFQIIAGSRYSSVQKFKEATSAWQTGA